MTISTTTTRNDFTGTSDPATHYNFTFKATLATWVKVTIAGALQASGYTVVLNADQDAIPGGYVAFLVAPGPVAVGVYRETPLTQATSLAAYSPFPAKSVEHAFDKQVMMLQDLDLRRVDLTAAQANAAAAEAAAVAAQASASDAAAAVAAAAVPGSSSLVMATGGTVPDTLANWMADVAALAHLIPSTTPTSFDLSFPGLPGAYAPAAIMGARPQALTFARPSAATFLDGFGAEQSAASGLVRVTPNGALLELGKTNYYPNSDAPTGQSITLAPGTYTMWVKGTGYQYVHVNTATATGLPGVANAAGLTFTITVGGSIIVDAVFGSVTFAQLEDGGQKTAAIHTTTPVTRSPDAASVPNPLAGYAGPWAVETTWTPNGPWNDPNDNIARLWTLGGNDGAANTATVYCYTGTVLRFSIQDAGGGQKTFSVNHGLADATKHVITACSDNLGNMSLYIDGVAQAGVVAGAGTGILGSQPANLYLSGNSGGGHQFTGTLSRVRVFRSATPPAPVSGGRWLWLSDSIFNIAAIQTTVSAALGNKAITVDAGTYGGTVVGSGLLETADVTYAYLGGAWSLKARGVPWNAYAALIFEYARNDANNSEPIQAFRRAYEKVLTQAAKYVSKVISSNAPPLALANLSAWDPSNDKTQTDGFNSAIAALVLKWGQAHVDIWNLFDALVTAGTYRIIQIMYDAIHPNSSHGGREIGNRLAAAYSAASPLLSASPEITGGVVNYLFGQPTAGVWVQTTGLVSSTGPTQSPLNRIAGLTDQANVAAGSGAIVAFPPFVCASGNGQVWAHFLVDSASGGTVNMYVDKGTGSQVLATYNTQQAGVSLYTRSILIADGLAAGSHTVEIDTSSANPVRVLGVTYVGTP